MKKDLRADFPFMMNNRSAYLDSASTSQKPQSVINAITSFYSDYNANIYRGVHTYAEHATQKYEDTRSLVAQFIGAKAHELVFTSGTTEGINFIADTWGITHIKAGDEILITELEHHANILPWQRLAQRTGAKLIWYPVQEDGTLDISSLSQLITTKTKLVAVTALSNAIGTSIDVARFSQAAHAVGAKILVDAAQLAGHTPIHVTLLDADFLVFSGHKMFGPTGVGVLYIKEELHDQVPPYQLGGGMVFEVLQDHATWLKPPQKFEAGTPAIAQVIGLGAAIMWINENITWSELKTHEAALCARLIDGLSSVSKIRILGPLDELSKNGHLISFVIDGVHAHDAAAFLDNQNISVRAGHHCAQPLARSLGYSASVRASFAVYNNMQEIDQLIVALSKLSRPFNGC